MPQYLLALAKQITSYLLCSTALLAAVLKILVDHRMAAMAYDTSSDYESRISKAKAITSNFCEVL